MSVELKPSKAESTICFEATRDRFRFEDLPGCEQQQEVESSIADADQIRLLELRDKLENVRANCVVARSLGRRNSDADLCRLPCGIAEDRINRKLNND